MKGAARKSENLENENTSLHSHDRTCDSCVLPRLVTLASLFSCLSDSLTKEGNNKKIKIKS